MRGSPFQTFLDQLARVLEFPSLKPDAAGCCLIIMKESQIPLLFEYDSQLVPATVLVSTPISSIPASHSSLIYETCLKGNQQIEQTLSVKPDEETVFIHQRIHPQISEQDLFTLLHGLIRQIQHWQQHLTTLIQGPPQAPRFIVSTSQFQIPPHKKA